MVSLATTQIPEFGDEMESPHTGYQILAINGADYLTMQSGGTLFDPNREIMSMAMASSCGSAKLVDFTRMWQMLLLPSRHFFLIFHIDPLPPCSAAIGPTPGAGDLLANQYLQ